jgi:hypothetical protein
MAHNVTHMIDGEDLVIRIKIDPTSVQAAPPSSTGKTNLVGSTGGYISLDKSVAGRRLSYSLSVTAKQ